MKTSYMLIFFFSFFLSVLVAQNGRDSVVYTLADTAVANRLLKESVELNSKRYYDKAYAKADSAQLIFEKVLGKNYKGVIAALNQKGNSKIYQSKYDDALIYYQLAINIKLDTLNLDLANSYNNLGAIYFFKGNFNETIELYEKALTIRLKLLGSEHIEVANSYENIGSSYLNSVILNLQQ